jgi:hypothetical protein
MKIRTLSAPAVLSITITIMITMTLFTLDATAVGAAQDAQDHHAGVMKRGAHVMGFDQTTTTHHFRLTRAGGIIEVTANDAADKTAISQIQNHLRHIAVMFSEGNFTAPMLIHAQEPPGVAEMKRAGAAVGYKYEPLPRGGRVVVNTTAHVKAVHEFLRFQITDHKTGDPLEVTAERN